MTPAVPIVQVIDVGLLPRVAVIDAGVLMRFLEDRFADAESVAARAFVGAMLKAERQVMVPAPSLAEHLRGAGADFPSTKYLYVVAFDRRAALDLAATLPAPAQKAAGKESGRVGSAVKFDAMIVACAIRWQADVVVTMDADMLKLCRRAGVKAAMPSEYYAPQVEIPGC